MNNKLLIGISVTFLLSACERQIDFSAKGPKASVTTGLGPQLEQDLAEQGTESDQTALDVSDENENLDQVIDVGNDQQDPGLDQDPPVVVPQKKILVTIKNGKGSGSYEPGQRMDIQSDVLTGKIFDRWLLLADPDDSDVSIENQNASYTRVNLGSENVTIEAVYRTATEQRFELQVVGGYGSGQIMSGQKVRLEAYAPSSSQLFDRWDVAENLLASGSQRSTVIEIVMPARSLKIQALFKNKAIVINPPIVKPELKLSNGGPSSGFLWKPVSDSNGKLVVLLPSALRGKIARNGSGYRVHISTNPFESIFVAKDKGTFSGDTHNGNRPHFRFSKPGAAFGKNSYVIVHHTNGLVYVYKISSTNKRTENVNPQNYRPN